MFIFMNTYLSERNEKVTNIPFSQNFCSTNGTLLSEKFRCLDVTDT